MPCEINVPWLDELIKIAESNPKLINQLAGDAVEVMLKDYITMLNTTHPNKLGGERTGYYLDIADGITLEVDQEAATITIPSPFGYSWLGGDIYAKDKLLTVPARAEAHGHRAGDFDFLHFGMFKTGTKFLADPDGMIYFWLCDHVHYDGDPTLMPSTREIEEEAANAVENWWMSKLDSNHQQA